MRFGAAILQEETATLIIIRVNSSLVFPVYLNRLLMLTYVKSTCGSGMGYKREASI